MRNAQAAGPARLAILERADLGVQGERTLKYKLGQSPYCAALHFELGRHYYDRSQSNQAQQAFIRARDMDRLLFRAPTFFNQILHQLKGVNYVILLTVS